VRVCIENAREAVGTKAVTSEWEQGVPCTDATAYPPPTLVLTRVMRLLLSSRVVSSLQEREPLQLISHCPTGPGCQTNPVARRAHHADRVALARRVQGQAWQWTSVNNEAEISAGMRKHRDESEMLTSVAPRFSDWWDLIAWTQRHTNAQAQQQSVTVTQSCTLCHFHVGDAVGVAQGDSEGGRTGQGGGGAGSKARASTSEVHFSVAHSVEVM